MKCEPLTRGEKILAVASVGVVSLLLGGIAWQQRINAEPHIDFPPRAAMPSPNGFDAYLAAAKAIVTWKPPVDPASDGELVKDPRVRAQRYGLVRREAWLKANARGFALFKQAMSLPCRHPDVFTPEPSAMFSSYGRLRELARCKMAEADTFKLRGDWNAAMQSGLDTVQMGIDFPREGALMGMFLGSACTDMGKTSVKDVPERLNAAQAKAAARRLETLLVRRVSHIDAVKQEKWRRLDFFLTCTRTENWRQASSDASGSIFLNWIRRHTTSKTAIVRAIEQAADEDIADAQLPYSAPAPTEPPDESHDPFADWYKRLPSLRFSEANDKTRLNLLLLRLALRAYTVDHGTAPATLQQLAPGYLKVVPRDAFADEAPLRYVPDGKTYRLWSVGPDMKDDGGIPMVASKDKSSQLPGGIRWVGDWAAGNK